MSSSTTSLESASFTLKVIAEEDEENEEADCGRKQMVGGKGNGMLSTWRIFPRFNWYVLSLNNIIIMFISSHVSKSKYLY